MSNPLLIPLDIGGPGGAPFAHHGGFAPFHILGGLMFPLFLLLLLGTLFFLVKRGHITPPPWVQARFHSPEQEARKILAERFARGDISTEEFMERASVLNWTPGAEPTPPPRRPRKKPR